MPAINFGNNQHRIDQIRNRYNKTVDLVMEKVAAHISSPGQYPLPANHGSPEWLIHDLVISLSNHRQKKFMDKHGDNINASAAKRQQLYGDLAIVNLHSNVPIGEQVKNIELPQDKKMTKAEADGIIASIKAHAPSQGYSTGKSKGYATGKPQPQQAVLATRFAVSANTLTCNKTSEIRKDEISLGGFGIDALGVQQDKAPFFVGDFKKGTSIPLGANAKLFDLNLDVNGSVSEFPQVLSITLFLSEKDLIRQDVSIRLQNIAFALWGLFMLITAAIITIGVLGGPVTPLMAMIAVFIGLTFLIMAIQVIPVITDDTSTFDTDILIVDAQPPVGQVTDRTLNFELKNSDGDFTVGDYAAAIRWESVA